MAGARRLHHHMLGRFELRAQDATLVGTVALELRGVHAYAKLDSVVAELAAS